MIVYSATTVGLITTIINGFTLFSLGGEEVVWVCLGACAIDVVINAVAMYWAMKSPPKPSESIHLSPLSLSGSVRAPPRKDFAGDFAGTQDKSTVSSIKPSYGRLQILSRGTITTSSTSIPVIEVPQPTMPNPRHVDLYGEIPSGSRLSLSLSAEQKSDSIKGMDISLKEMGLSRVEIINDGGYRADGRKARELRSITIELSPHPTADGSATVSHGLTTVNVCVFGPREAKNRSQTMHDKALINVEISEAAFSSSERRKRGRNDKRTLEFAASIRATFEPVVQVSIYPRSEIDIFVQVLQQDGGVLQTAINAATLALIDAGIALTDYVCACTAACIDTTGLLDLTNTEESDLPNLTLAVLPRSKRVTLVTMETRLHVERFDQIFKLALLAGVILHERMRAAIRERTGKLVQSMTVGGIAPAVENKEEASGDVEMYNPS
ncbi:Exosome non-catalytic core component [Rhizoctonia solani]